MDRPVRGVNFQIRVGAGDRLAWQGASRRPFGPRRGSGGHCPVAVPAGDAAKRRNLASGGVLMIRRIAAVVLALHGVAHAVGFGATFQLGDDAGKAADTGPSIPFG